MDQVTWMKSSKDDEWVQTPQAPPMEPKNLVQNCIHLPNVGKLAGRTNWVIY
jgi:hypothetical protein